jgi:hypothetical protein
MKWLIKMFGKKKPTYKSDNSYKLLIINDDSDLLHHSLGISDTRVEELLQISIKAYNNNNTLHTALRDAVSECKHSNEVVMATLIVQKIVDKNDSLERSHSILRNLFGNG